MVLAFLLAAASLVVAPSQPPPALAAQLPACGPNQISWGLDGEGGQFDGMSQSGTLLVARNLGPGPCRLEALPALRFEDTAGRTLAAARRSPPGMHPGPVLLPVALAPDAEATATLHWVQGDVYDGHNCIRPTRLTVIAAGGRGRAPFAGQMCGPEGKPIPFDQPPLKTDPVLKPTP